MKVFTALLLSMMLLAGVVVAVDAQTSPPTSPSPPAPGSTPATPETRPGPSSGAPAVGSDQPRTGPDVNVDIRSRRDDSPAASPRTSSETRIFGLSPTMAILIAAALFVVVILALVSMTRNGGSRTDTHLDLDRRA